MDSEDKFVLSAMRRDSVAKLAKGIDNPVVEVALKQRVWLLDYIEELSPGATTQPPLEMR